MPRTRIERRVLFIAVIALAAILALGATAFAASSSTTPTVPLPSLRKPASKPATPTAGVGATPTLLPDAKGSYALDFTLPTFGKSGCLVCHGDPTLVVAKGDSTHSFWIDEAQYRRSAHAGVVCTGCHVDYGYKAPHGQAGADWRSVAKQSCKNCHSRQFDDWNNGGHGIRPQAGKPDPKAADKPLCGDCHGGHDMPITKGNPAGRAQLHARSQEMCGREGCHADYWESYGDYYHGAAYKAGAEDAPACWECHGTHLMLGSDHRDAPTHPDNFDEALESEKYTCATCHKGMDAKSRLASYVPLIHGRARAVEKNPVYSLISTLLGRNK